MVDPHINTASYPAEALESFLQLALSCCREMPEARPTMAELVRDLEELGRRYAGIFPDGYSLDMPMSSHSMPSSRTTSTTSSLPMSYPTYSASQPEDRDHGDASELLSGTVMHVAPR